jgi:ribosomal protein L6P/L9E
MKYILTQEAVEIPAGVEITVKSRNVEVKGNCKSLIQLGPLGTLKRNFKSANVDI